nr:zinc finger, CCHC-type [Tanacetum cinerariifolium]
MITPYKLWTKKKPNLNYFKVWGCRAVISLHDPKLKTLGERGIECIFVGYVEHSKAFRFYVLKPNDSVAINSIIKLRDAIFDENRFSSVPRLSQKSLVIGTKDIGGSVVLKKVTEEVVQQHEPELKKSKRNRSLKYFRPDFQLYLIEGTMDIAFWKEAINDEMDSIMGNNTWVLADLTSGSKPLGCKWIFKTKLKVDGTVEKFKAILIIHQMDVKTAFSHGELDEEVYMNQPQGFIMPDNENNVCMPKNRQERRSRNRKSLQQSSIPNSLATWGKDDGVTMLVKSMLDGSGSVPLSQGGGDLLKEGTTGNTNIRQCLRKVADVHFTAAMKVLSSSGVAPYCDDTIKALEAIHPYKPPLSMSSNTFSEPLLVAEIDSVVGRIKSFPKGTLCRRDGLRAQHILDVICGEGSATAKNLLKTITLVVNLWLAGRCPPMLVEFVASAPLTPLLT